MGRKLGKEKLALFIISIIMVTVCYGQKIVVIKDPKPTHFEKTYTPLKMIKSLSIDINIDENNFIGRIGSSTIDKDGNLFIFDDIQANIFKFDENLKYITKFGRKGKGPGEFASRFHSNEINVGLNNRLYVSDKFNKRIHIFSLNGKFIGSHKIEYPMMFKPAVSNNGDIYMPSLMDDRIIDVYNKNMKLITTLLDRKEFDRFIFKKPSLINRRFFTHTFYGRNVYYHLLPDDKMLVLIINEPTIYIFENLKLIKKIKILPNKVLKDFKRDYLKEQLADEESYFIFVPNFFLDADDFKFFYLQFPKDKSQNRDVLYKFSLDGRLVEVFYIKHKEENIYIGFLFKQNNIFYAENRENIILYKEVK